MQKKILITGSSGLIGSYLGTYLTEHENDIFRLRRVKKNIGEHTILWEPVAGLIDPKRLENFNVIIHLGGENISAHRWSMQQKNKIKNSRVRSTRILTQTLINLQSPPELLITASAVGYYGHRNSKLLDETSSAGDLFLSEVCAEWEKVTEPAAAAGIRVVNLRFGMVLSMKGGALPRLLQLIKIGLGGTIGNGRQYVSWVTLEDVASAVIHIINTRQISGAVNMATPHPVTNRELTKILGQILRRPTVMRVPAFVLKLVYGQMAKELLLSSMRVYPAKLLETGFRFKHPTLESAVELLLDH
jgi:uncharacterized protein (TIGR01777 family)